MNDIGHLSVAAVVPTYNRADLLGETLESILRQTRTPDEIIVVDDGSTDDTVSFLSRYGAPVRCITIENSGDLVARNVGLRAAGSEIVAFCDSDDLWQPEYLSKLVAFWRHVPHIHTVYSNFFEMHQGVRATSSKFDAAPSGFWSEARVVENGNLVIATPFVEKLLAFQPFFTSCMSVRRERFLALGGWDETTSRMIGCDFATALRVAENPPFGVFVDPLVGIRKHGGNISGDVQRMNLGDAGVLDVVLRSRPSMQPYAEAIRASIVARRRAALDTAFARGDFEGVRKIAAMVPAAVRSRRDIAKIAVAHLPRPARQAAWSMLTRLGSMHAKRQPAP